MSMFALVSTKRSATSGKFQAMNPPLNVPAYNPKISSKLHMGKTADYNVVELYTEYTSASDRRPQIRYLRRLSLRSSIPTKAVT